MWLLGHFALGHSLTSQFFALLGSAKGRGECECACVRVLGGLFLKIVYIKQFKNKSMDISIGAVFVSIASFFTRNASAYSSGFQTVSQ